MRQLPLRRITDCAVKNPIPMGMGLWYNQEYKRRLRRRIAEAGGENAKKESDCHTGERDVLYLLLPCAFCHFIFQENPHPGF